MVISFIVSLILLIMTNFITKSSKIGYFYIVICYLNCSLANARIVPFFMWEFDISPPC